MSNYTDNSNSCRVDFFKASGKWYTTEAIVFENSTYDDHPIDALLKALRSKLGNRLSEMTAVCLEPYCENSYPLMIRDWGSKKLLSE
jgi:hypothetical protein